MMIECTFLNKLLLYCGYHSLVQEEFQRNISFNIVEIASETLEKTFFFRKDCWGLFYFVFLYKKISMRLFMKQAKLFWK